MPPESSVRIRVAISDTSMDHMIDPTSYLSKKDAERTKAIAARTRIMDRRKAGPSRKSWISPKARTIITIDRSPEARKAFRM
jgi:hypothetical protein